MKTATEIINQIQSYGEQTANDSTIRIVPEVGKYAAQGDVNFIFLPKVPKGAVSAEPVIQLAPGNSKGSRHCIRLADINHVQFFKLPNPNPLQGPILVFNEETMIEHPEHGNHVYPKGSIVAVTYQRRYAEELRRVED